MPTDFWTILSAISTAVGAITIVVASILALSQLREMAKARFLEALIKLFEELNAPEARAARAFVFQELPSDPTEINGIARKNVETVYNQLDFVGFLVENKLA